MKTSPVGALLVGIFALAPGCLMGQDAPIKVGSRAPAVVVNDLDGKPVDLARFIGSRPVFLEFWATWCESCKALLPRVRAAQVKYGDQVEFIGINVTVNQTPQGARDYLAQHQLALRALYDDAGNSIRAYQVPATSYVVIADRSGKVVYTGIGPTQNFDRALRQVAQQ
ncbi:MAG: TlpA family protein disulfide reductase [Gemmatimonadales bacterium]